MSKLTFNTRTDIYSLINLYNELRDAWSILLACEATLMLYVISSSRLFPAAVLLVVMFATAFKLFVTHKIMTAYIDQGQKMVLEAIEEKRQSLAQSEDKPT